MHELILWAGFLGAWLLVAGPLHQAVLELEEEEFERESFETAAGAVARPDRVSSWWWLLPPAHLYLSRRSKERWSSLVMAQMPDEDYEALDSFMKKARGWMLVGTGGLLIACKETYELVEGNHWEMWVFWVLLVVMAGLCLGNAARVSRRAGRTNEKRRGRQEALRPRQ